MKEDQKYVLENFSEFVDKFFSKNINETKESGEKLTIQVSEEILQYIYEKNVELLKNKIKETSKENIRDDIKNKSLDFINKGNGAKAFLTLLAHKITTREDLPIKTWSISGIKFDETNRKKSAEDLIERLEDSTRKDFIDDKEAVEIITSLQKVKLPEGKFWIPSIFRPTIMWLILPEIDKKQMSETFTKLALKKGYQSKEQLLNVTDDNFKKRKSEKKISMFNPGYKIGVETNEIIEVVTQKKITYLITEQQQSQVFKPNATGENGEADFEPNVFSTIVKNLSDFFNNYSAGKITKLTKIEILTSSDRYRNTGNAEKLSWGQLSYARAVSISKVIEAVAIESGINDELIKQIPKIITIYFEGENGDGSSGPNPPEGIKFGYYEKDGNNVKWVDGKDRKELIISEAGEEGEPSEKISKKTETPLNSKQDYNEFRYSNVYLEYEETDNDGLTGEVVPNVLFPTQVSIPNRFKKVKITLIPPITLKKNPRGKSGMGTKCPEFGKKSSLKMGLNIPEITISKTKDLAK